MVEARLIVGGHDRRQTADVLDVMHVPNWDGPPLIAPPLWTATEAPAGYSAYGKSWDREGTTALMPTLPASRSLTLEDFQAIRDVEDGHR
ncbi:hypothetical protein MWU75_00695 [Ornithinimicrobium sp. F0845]|uniref:hypothetical protein n=1 Tax=Ornithinimicrobium sp. F0845 TaxID=2926412 RepID=UPI001FF6F0FF|nr:hypothetical protein [Ornithinimicrobium sp. F0845]MCK0110664.1 hypothetical protein [Ornithinimicrobium sp. F0845]